MLCSKSLISYTFCFLRLSIRYRSCIFHPCCLLLIFPLLLFPLLHFQRPLAVYCQFPQKCSNKIHHHSAMWHLCQAVWDLWVHGICIIFINRQKKVFLKENTPIVTILRAIYGFALQVDRVVLLHRHAFVSPSTDCAARLADGCANERSSNSAAR